MTPNTISTLSLTIQCSWLRLNFFFLQFFVFPEKTKSRPSDPQFPKYIHIYHKIMEETHGDHRQFDQQLQRAIAGPISAQIQTMNNSSFLVFNDDIVDEDSDQEDFERYQDVGLREQLFITLSRAIKQSEQHDHINKITETSVPDSIKRKRKPEKKRLNTNNSKQTQPSKPTKSKSFNGSSYNIVDHHNNHNKMKTYSKYENRNIPHSHGHHNDKRNKKMRAYDNATTNHLPMTIPIHSKNKRLDGPIPSSPVPNVSSNQRETHKKTHRRQGSHLRHYAKRANEFGVTTSDQDFESHLVDESESDSDPLPQVTALHVKTTGSDHDITTTLEQVRKDRSDKILSTLPPTSRTPRVTSHGNVDVVSRFNTANNQSTTGQTDTNNLNHWHRNKNNDNKSNKMKRKKSQSSKTHSERDRKKQRTPSSRGYPPPPGQLDIYKDNNLRHFDNTGYHSSYNHTNGSQKRHSDELKSSTIPPPPSSPSPLPSPSLGKGKGKGKGKNKSNYIHDNANPSTRGRQVRHSEWRKHSANIHNQQQPPPPQNPPPPQDPPPPPKDPPFSATRQKAFRHQPLQPPTSKSAGYNGKSQDPRRNVQKYKHSYNGPSYDIPVPQKQNNLQNNSEDPFYHRRSHSKDGIDIKKQSQNTYTLQTVAVDVDANIHSTPVFENNSMSLPLSMKVDPITGRMVPSSAGVPPPPGSVDLLLKKTKKKQYNNNIQMQNMYNAPPPPPPLQPSSKSMMINIEQDHHHAPLRLNHSQSHQTRNKRTIVKINREQHNHRQ